MLVQHGTSGQQRIGSIIKISRFIHKECRVWELRQSILAERAGTFRNRSCSQGRRRWRALHSPPQKTLNKLSFHA